MTSLRRVKRQTRKEVMRGAQTPINKVSGGGSYFSKPNTSIEFISTGCKNLDLALGGGWAEGRIANIVGDKSSGKTLQCIEASANFAMKYPKATVRYREAEAAFDESYAEALGMPISRIDFGDKPLETVEDLFEDLNHYCSKAKGPELYICDSLDALSDRAEMGRDINEGTYGAAKAKQLSQMFRRLTQQMNRSGMTLIIVSQIRDKMNVMYGKKVARTGGRALDFYASQVVYLQQIKTLSKTIKKVKRPIGIQIKAKVEKNKVSLPFREAEFPIIFGYGVDDKQACIDWMKSVGTPFKVDTQLSLQQMHQRVERRWFEIETQFLPTTKKYNIK